MRSNLYWPIRAVLLLFVLSNASATVHYVSVTSTNPVSPYTNWATAATNIQDACSQSLAYFGDMVLVTNGIYQYGSIGTARINVIGFVVKSVNGPKVTTIVGSQTQYTSTNHSYPLCCASMSAGTLSGFTLSGGATPLNSGNYAGGGVRCQDGTSIITNCIITGNNGGVGGGGGAFFGTLVNCTISNNVASNSASAALCSSLINCVINANAITSTTFTNGGTVEDCFLYNCTLVNNTATLTGAGVVCNFENCVVYSNSPNNSCKNIFKNCCIDYTPDPGSSNNITNAPAFVNFAGGDFHLSANSPCINSGANQYVTNTTDLDGNPRIVAGTVDIGAYEYQTPASVLSYAWAQQYGLATDGSADLTDADGDGLNNWQEWKAGTNPTNAASTLQMTTVSNSVSGTTVTWQSVSGITYYLQRSTNLGMVPAFSSLQRNLAGQAGTTSYTDTGATNAGPYFYRVGVQLN